MGRVKLKNSKEKDTVLLQLLSNGMSANQIVEMTGLPSSTVYRRLQYIKRDNFVKPKYDFIPTVKRYSIIVNGLLDSLESITSQMWQIEDVLFQDYITGKIHNNSTYKQLTYNQTKEMVLSHYCKDGIIKCQCCGERLIKLLTIDHENEDGKHHRRQYKGSLYKHLIDMNFKVPYKLRVYCYNCNIGAYRNHGVCPHQTP